jgi:type III restriction enzyme
LGDDENDKTRYDSGLIDSGTIEFSLEELKDDKHIIQKALNIHARKDNSLFRFSNLKEELSISSMNDIFEENFFGNMKIEYIIPKEIFAKAETKETRLDLISNEQKLKGFIRFFDKLGNDLKQIVNPYIGSEFSSKNVIALFGEPKTKSIIEDAKNTELEKELKSKDWYALNAFHGTSEEHNLVNFLKGFMGNFESQYDKIHLLRNEEVYKIYDFKTGKGFQPDFILVLKKKEENTFYQVFIEPKGGQFADEDGLFEKGKEGWKESFLQEITKRYSEEKTLKIENKEYRLIGLPLYNEKIKPVFEESIWKHLSVKI